MTTPTDQHESSQEDFQSWIGRSSPTSTDLITQRLLDSFNATFSNILSDNQTVPLGLHWCLAPQIVPANEVGHDGHPKKGDFLPPIPLPRRMWASGSVEFQSSLNPSDVIEKKSTIENIAWKKGGSGKLCFVTLGHEYFTLNGLGLTEKQVLVYREPDQLKKAPKPVAKTKENDRRVFEHQWQVHVDEVLLFRYSALTFNGHRIHYDAPYAKESEHYPERVIHGPLQATLMLNLAASLSGAEPKAFSFRGTAPATGAQLLTIGVNQSSDTSSEISVLTADGVESMRGTLQW